MHGKHQQNSYIRAEQTAECPPWRGHNEQGFAPVPRQQTTRVDLIPQQRVIARVCEDDLLLLQLLSGENEPDDNGAAKMASPPQCCIIRCSSDGAAAAAASTAG